MFGHCQSGNGGFICNVKRVEELVGSSPCTRDLEEAKFAIIQHEIFLNALAGVHARWKAN
jgi:hypothetical protein